MYTLETPRANIRSIDPLQNKHIRQTHKKKEKAFIFLIHKIYTFYSISYTRLCQEVYLRRNGFRQDALHISPVKQQKYITFFRNIILVSGSPRLFNPYTLFCTRIKILFFPNIMRNACARKRALSFPFRGKALQILYGNKTAGPHSDNRMSKIKGSTVKNTR